MTREEIEADEREEARAEKRRGLRDPETGFGVIEDEFWNVPEEDEDE